MSSGFNTDENSIKIKKKRPIHDFILAQRKEGKRSMNAYISPFLN